MRERYVTDTGDKDAARIFVKKALARHGGARLRSIGPDGRKALKPTTQ